MLTATTLDTPEPGSQARQMPPQITAPVKAGGLYELGEAYIRGEWEADDLADLLYEIATRPVRKSELFKPRFLASIARQLLVNPQKGDGAFEVARRHYDLGNDLFSAMLDSTMTYTCGYWKDAASLDDAQRGKLALICEKLGLAPGMKVLDIGCGWGNFAKFAAESHGVSVVGLTVSKEQAELARERCKGLPVEIRLEDYRSFRGRFDRIVSIEMIEAVGRKNIGAFFDMAERCLYPGGLFLLQVISAETLSKESSASLDQFILWLQKRIFPNGCLPRISELARPAAASFVLEDLHNFSADYEMTLKAWDANFQRAWPDLKEAYGEPFRRMWRYYLNGCQAVFRARMVQLYQVVYSKGGVPGGYRSVR